jgi:hypothetical protein
MVVVEAESVNVQVEPWNARKVKKVKKRKSHGCAAVKG